VSDDRLDAVAPGKDALAYPMPRRKVAGVIRELIVDDSERTDSDYRETSTEHEYLMSFESSGFSFGLGHDCWLQCKDSCTEKSDS